MLRNAELSQQLTSLQQTSTDEKQAFEEEKKALETELNIKTESENDLRLKCEGLENRVCGCFQCVLKFTYLTFEQAMFL